MDVRVSKLRFRLATMVGAVLLAVLLAGPPLVLGTDSAHADDDDRGDFVPRQIVVKLKPRTDIGTINKKYGTRTLERLLGSKKIYLLKVPKGKNPDNLAERMINGGGIIYAEPNFRTATPEGDGRHRAHPGGTPEPSSDPAPYPDQYAIQTLNLEAAHAITGGEGSVVAVIDTGVQLGHPELSGSFTEERYDFIDDDRGPKDVPNGVDDDGNGEVDEMVGHGTHVAGIVKLAAPEATIMPLRALNSDGLGNVFVLAEAIQYASRNGADVVNLSLGSTRESDLLEDLIGDDDDDDSSGRDAIFVAAAGNENTSASRYPAAEDGALAVTSVDQERKKSSFANYGGWVDVAAPGSEIYSPFPTNQYALWDGTSMATPFVAGQAALIRSLKPSAGPACVAGIIRTTAQSLDASNPTYIGMLGSGHTDAWASAEYARSGDGCPAGDGAGGDD